MRLAPSGRRGTARLAAAIVLSGLLAVTGSAAALAADLVQADERSAALWPANDWYFYDELQADGATGAGVKIAVIDDGINLEAPELAGANITVQGSTCIDPATGAPWEIVSADPALSAHGTNVVSMLVGNGTADDGGLGARGIAPEAEILFYGLGDFVNTGPCVKHDPTQPPGQPSLVDDLAGDKHGVIDNSDGHLDKMPLHDIQFGSSAALAVRAAIRDGADVISVSLEEGDADGWRQALIESFRAGVPIVASAPNPDQVFTITVGVQSFNGMVAVNAVNEAGEPIRDPNTNLAGVGSRNLAFVAPGLNLLGVGTESGWGPSLVHGASYATPLVAGTIALGLQKFPDATANQVLQAMVRTTGVGDVHELEWIDNELGFGFVSPQGLLASDPMQYPDENPLYVTSIDDPRCIYSDGTGGGTINQRGDWECEWATSPTPEMEAAYWAGRDADEPTPGSDEPATAVSPVLWIAAGVTLLVVVAAAIAIPVAIARSRRRPGAPAQSQTPPVYSNEGGAQ